MGNEYVLLVVIEHIHNLMDRLVRTRAERIVILQDSHFPKGTAQGDVYQVAVEAVRNAIKEDDAAAEAQGMKFDEDYRGFEIVEVRQLTNVEVIGAPVNGREVPAV